MIMWGSRDRQIKASSMKLLLLEEAWLGWLSLVLWSHSLRVTQMEFSFDDKFLLAVSSDRQLPVFSIDITGNEDAGYKLLAKHEAHKRIIWSCSWNPHGYEFATGSRDKIVKIWTYGEDVSVKLLATLPQFSSSVTAISWAGLDSKNNKGLLAVGMENGLIDLWSLSVNITENGVAGNVHSSLVARFDPLMFHVSSVIRLAWRNRKNEDRSSIQLASFGADHCVRVFELLSEGIWCVDKQLELYAVFKPLSKCKLSFALVNLLRRIIMIQKPW